MGVRGLTSHLNKAAARRPDLVHTGPLASLVSVCALTGTPRLLVDVSAAVHVPLALVRRFDVVVRCKEGVEHTKMLTIKLWLFLACRLTRTTCYWLILNGWIRGVQNSMLLYWR